ncbi:MAG: hypothetical protein K5872_08750 [Rhizobiaceae bacterium]|nr:hypothetical protein [Rhizobiaceae bacterium]MCV0406303.1 hypothetical protein [Rhizobiaceae bacterium]
MRILISSLSVLALCSAALADTEEDLSACRRETDSLVRLRCYDQIDVPATDPRSSTQTSSEAAPVTMTNAMLRHQERNPDRGIYSPRLELRLSFANASEKTVVAIGHRVEIRDAFGDVVVDQEGKLDIRIPAGETASAGSFYYWEDNQFIPNDPYSLLVGAVDASTAKVAVTVDRVIYSDGSIVSY